MKTVRVKRNTEAFLEGQKVEVVEERPDGLMLRGVCIANPLRYPEVVINGPILAMDVEEV